MPKKPKFKVGDRIILQGVIFSHNNSDGDVKVVFDGGNIPTDVLAGEVARAELFVPPLTFSPAQIAFVDQLQAVDKKTVLAAMRKRKEK